MYPPRVSSITVYGGHGEAIQLSVDVFHTHSVRQLTVMLVCSQRKRVGAAEEALHEA